MLGNFFPLKSHLLRDYVEKYCRAGQATDDNMAHAHCMLDIKGYKHTITEYVILIPFHCNNGCTNAPQCYVSRTLPVLFCSH